MKHTFYSLLPLFLLLDLVIPFLLAPTYPGYRHTRQVMSVLGNRSAPFHTVYTLWLLFLGTAILLTCAQLCPLLWGRSGGLSLALGNLDHLRSGRLHFVRIVSCIRNQGDGDFVRKDSRFRVGVGFSGADLRSAGRCTVLFQRQADRPCPVCAGVLSPGVGILRAVRYGGQAPVCPHRDRMGGAVAAADPADYVSSPGAALCQRRTMRKEQYQCRR